MSDKTGISWTDATWTWARSLRDQCQAAGVAFWWKQQGGLRPGTGTLLDGREYHELPPEQRGLVPA